MIRMGRTPVIYRPFTPALLSYGRRPDVHVFRWPGSVLGARCPAFGVDSAPVPGTRSQVSDSRYPIPGTRYLAPVFEKRAHRVCMM